MTDPESYAPPQGFGYWLQWQILLSALIFALPAAISIFVIRKNSIRDGVGNSPLRTSDIWTTCWKNLHPQWLLLYRASAFLVLAFFMYKIAFSHGLIAFFFYTQWTLLLVTVYFLLATIVSARGCRIHGRNLSDQTKDDNVSASALIDKNRNGFAKLDHLGDANTSQQLDLLDNVLLAVYQTSAGASMLTDIVFWGLLLPFLVEDFELTLLMAYLHSLNAVLLVIDTLLNCLPCNWFGIHYFLLWSFTYVVYQWILHACCMTWWPYPFLELSTPWAPLWYLAMALVHLPCYGTYVWLTKAKYKAFPKMFPSAFVRDKLE